MQRHPSLIPLSHDHHHGLAVSWRIRQALKKHADPMQISAEVLLFWNQELKRHFDEEEQFIFPLVPDSNENLQRAMREHLELREMLAMLEAENDDEKKIGTLQAFAFLLTEHIRFEERVLFPEIEQATSEEALSQLARQFHH